MIFNRSAYPMICSRRGFAELHRDHACASQLPGIASGRTLHQAKQTRDHSVREPNAREGCARKMQTTIQFHRTRENGSTDDNTQGKMLLRRRRDRGARSAGSHGLLPLFFLPLLVRGARQRFHAVEAREPPAASASRHLRYLYRVPREASSRAVHRIIRKESAGASRLLKVSGNPFVTTLEARMLCAEHNVTPNL